MVRFLSSVDLSRDHYEQTETFALNGVSCGMELFEVDLARRKLIPLRGIVGNLLHLLVSLTSSPSLPLMQCTLTDFSRDGVIWAYTISRTGGLAQRKIFRPDALGRFFPCACHWELGDYLVCDIEWGHSLLISGFVRFNPNPWGSRGIRGDWRGF